MRIVAVLNHKGGVGKTTFTGSVAQALALCGFRVCALDNDSQHNLSSLLGTGVQSPSIRDCYRADSENASATLLRAVRTTPLPNLHCITADKHLCDANISEHNQLKTAIHHCGLERYYDFIIIDNAPGLGRLQGAAIMAADEIFVPVELRQFAVDGLLEMSQTIAERYPGGAAITRIIPNFFKNTKRQRSFLAALNTLFPGKVTNTAIAVDQVFDEVVTDGKILFLHRLYSSGAAHYLKIIHELFDLNEETIWEQLLQRRSEHISQEARERFYKRKNHNGLTSKK